MIDTVIFLPERLESMARIVKKEQRIGNKKTIVFCRSFSHLKLVNAHFPQARPYHSDLSKGILKRRLQAFRDGDLRIILVVDKFNEAIDIPDAELLVFLRSTNSEAIWKQQLGRGCRKADGKESVVVLDFVVNCKRFFTVRQFATEVKKSGKRDQMTVNLGMEVRFVERAVELVELLDYLEQGFYSTWEEASAATQKLGIKTAPQYTELYRQDPLLHSSPYLKYSDVWKKKGGWKGFLGTGYYPTWEEASAVARKLGFKKGVDYLRGYKIDSLLPSDPAYEYSNVWHNKGSWPGFLGVKKVRKVKDPYSNWEEASAVAQRLGIKTALQYSELYRHDPRLHSRPYIQYSDVWKKKGGWPGFLGKKNGG